MPRRCASVRRRRAAAADDSDDTRARRGRDCGRDARISCDVCGLSNLTWASIAESGRGGQGILIRGGQSTVDLV